METDDQLPTITASQFMRRLRGVPRLMGGNPVMAVTCRGKPVLVLVKAEEWEELVSLVKELRAVTAER